MNINDYNREDGWLLVSVYAFGLILHNKYTKQTVRVPQEHE